MKKLSERVKSVLEINPKARDSVALTITHLWLGDLTSMGYSRDTIRLPKFFELLINKKLTDAQNVGRAWRLIQERNVHLRGKDYNKRHNIAEPEVRKFVKEYSNPPTPDRPDLFS